MLALVIDGQVKEQRDISIEEVPAHKRSYWRPVVDEKPALSDTQYLSATPEIVVEPGRVVRRWLALEYDRPALIDLVKAEAQRRIIALTGANELTASFVKQSNANMRANELNDKRIRGDVLTAEEEAEAAALRELAKTIKNIRARSNAIEAMNPIPADFRHDRYWA